MLVIFCHVFEEVKQDRCVWFPGLLTYRAVLNSSERRLSSLAEFKVIHNEYVNALADNSSTSHQIQILLTLNPIPIPAPDRNSKQNLSQPDAGVSSNLDCTRAPPGGPSF